MDLYKIVCSNLFEERLWPSVESAHSYDHLLVMACQLEKGASKETPSEETLFCSTDPGLREDNI